MRRCGTRWLGNTPFAARLAMTLRFIARHGLLCTFIVSEVAITGAILMNTVPLALSAGDRLRIAATGVGDGAVLVARPDIVTGPAGTSTAFATMDPNVVQSLAAPSCLPGQVALANALPFSGEYASTATVRNRAREPAVDAQAQVVFATAAFPGLVGARLELGRGYTPDEIRPYSDDALAQAGKVLLPRALAASLFGDAASALGQLVELRNAAVRVIGILDALPRSQFTDPNEADNTVLVPIAPAAGSTYLLLCQPREGPEQLDRSLNDTDVSWQIKPLEQYKADYFGQDHATWRVLLGVAVAFVVVSVFSTTIATRYLIFAQRESLAIECMLGATITRIFVNCLWQSAVLVALGGILSVAFGMIVESWLLRTMEIQATSMGFKFTTATANALLPLLVTAPTVRHWVARSVER